MTDLDNRVPIDLDNPGAYELLLRNLQGNIIKGHARDFANHIFVTFAGDAEAAGKWLRALEPAVTSAFQQQQDSNEFKRTGRVDIPFLSLLLTANGYEYLGLKHQMPREQGESFRKGMRKAGHHLNDPPPNQWDNPTWQSAASIHCMILVANDDQVRLEHDTDGIIHSLKAIGDSFVEKGHMLYPDGDKRRPREHFGYVDGISNPIFDKQDLEEEDGYQANGSGWRFSAWDPFAALKILLVREPGDSPLNPRCGSFLVFRKLEQNVKSFQDDTRRLSTRLSPGYNTEDHAKALVMGRFPDGTPLTLHANPVSSKIFSNDFTYLARGGRCPFRGHVRRANPRGEQEPPREEEALRRITRRGIPYGVRAKDLNDSPRDGVGLLFMCYQSDIVSQFEHIQKEWCNWEFNFDAIIGQGQAVNKLPPVEQARNTEWPKKWASTAPELAQPIADWPAQDRMDGYSFGRYVTLKGGEYFFAPSKPFLRSL